jgi:hypothetical protein
VDCSLASGLVRAGELGIGNVAGAVSCLFVYNCAWQYC